MVTKATLAGNELDSDSPSQKSDLSQTGKEDFAVALSTKSGDKSTLAAMLMRKHILEEELQEGDGLDEVVGLVWESNELDIKQKIDAYGQVMLMFEEQTSYLKNLKNQIASKASAVEKRKARLKARLNVLCQDEPLRGNLYSFLPYITRRKHARIEELSEDEIYVTVELKLKDWNRLLTAFQEGWYTPDPETGKMDSLDVIARDDIGAREIKRSYKVSELPSNHPAVFEENERSVRITN